MRALIFDGQSVQLDRNYPAPKSQPGEAVIRLSKALISSSDFLGISPGSNNRGAIGHQFLGVVDSVSGDSVITIGKRVVGNPASFCGKCDMCVAGLSRHCRQRSLLGTNGRAGCLADRFVMPAANLTIVPTSVDDDQAVFAVEIAAAMQAAGQLTIEGKPYITVLGDSTLALLTAQFMSRLNASVRLIGEHDATFTRCEKWGIKHRAWNEVGRRADQDVVVECTGTIRGMDLALSMVRPRGKVLLKSNFACRGNNPDSDIFNAIVCNEIDVIGSFHGSIPDAIAALERRQVEVTSLIAKRMKLDEAAGVFRNGLPMNGGIIVEA